MSSNPDIPAPSPPLASAEISKELARFVGDFDDGIIFLDRQWRIVYANESARRSSRIEAHHLNEPSHWEIRLVLNNLIANAIDAMRQGGRLVIRARDVRAKDAVAALRITVADTGHGMSCATQARIFEPFFTTKNLNGTGLGLWISAEIVERHQGRIMVRSCEHERRHGTVFSVILPVSADNIAPARPL